MFDKLSNLILWVASTSLFTSINKNMDSEYSSNLLNLQNNFEYRHKDVSSIQNDLQDPLSAILFASVDTLQFNTLNSIASPTAGYRNDFDSLPGSTEISNDFDDEFDEHFRIFIFILNFNFLVDRAVSPLASPTVINEIKPNNSKSQKNNQNIADSFDIENDWLNILRDPLFIAEKSTFTKFLLPNFSKIRNSFSSSATLNLEIDTLNINSSSIKFNLPSIDILDCLFYSFHAISIQTALALKNDNSDMLKLNFLKHVVGLGIGNKSLNITSLILDSISKLFIEDSIETVDLDDNQLSKLLFSCNKVKLRAAIGENFATSIDKLPLLPTLQLSTVRFLHSLLDEYKQDFIPIFRSCKLNLFIFTSSFYFLPLSITNFVNPDLSKFGFGYEKFKYISQNIATLNGLYPSNFSDHLINILKLSSLQLYLRIISATETPLNFNQNFEMSDSRVLIESLESFSSQVVSIVKQILILLPNNIDSPIDINITKNLLILDKGD